jgi:hypothetical protein
MTLHRRIQTWRELQAVYMPSVNQLPEASYPISQSVEKPESIPLLLPSSIPPSHWPAGSLANKEKRLRIAQADDALADLRRLLRITMGLWDYKTTQIGSGQKVNTRTSSIIGRFRDKINRCTERYRAARDALLKLDPCGDWMTRLRVLEPTDVRAPIREEDWSQKEFKHVREREGKRELSWIWMVQSGEERMEGDTSQASEEEIGQSELGDVIVLLSFAEFLHRLAR